mmetsp:Transcript_12235/g.23029  ORF Transcript_12235/g.23029 Transcript_12235/m.23029 type:complete len:303 (-) Transcript_12235:973-1881(-)
MNNGSHHPLGFQVFERKRQPKVYHQQMNRQLTQWIQKLDDDRKSLWEERLHELDGHVHQNHRNAPIHHRPDNNFPNLPGEGLLKHLSERVYVWIGRIPQENQNPRFQNLPQDAHTHRHEEHVDDPKSPVDEGKGNRGLQSELDPRLQHRIEERQRAQVQPEPEKQRKNTEFNNEQERDFQHDAAVREIRVRPLGHRRDEHEELSDGQAPVKRLFHPRVCSQAPEKDDHKAYRCSQRQGCQVARAEGQQILPIRRFKLCLEVSRRPNQLVYGPARLSRAQTHVQLVADPILQILKRHLHVQVC